MLFPHLRRCEAQWVSSTLTQHRKPANPIINFLYFFSLDGNTIVEIISLCWSDSCCRFIFFQIFVVHFCHNAACWSWFWDQGSKKPAPAVEDWSPKHQEILSSSFNLSAFSLLHSNIACDIFLTLPLFSSHPPPFVPPILGQLSVSSCWLKNIPNKTCPNCGLRLNWAKMRTS